MNARQKNGKETVSKKSMSGIEKVLPNSRKDVEINNENLKKIEKIESLRNPRYGHISNVLLNQR